MAQLEAELAEVRARAEARVVATAEQVGRHGEARREAALQLEAVAGRRVEAEAEAEATRRALGSQLEAQRAREREEEALLLQRVRAGGGGAGGGGGVMPPSATQAQQHVEMGMGIEHVRADGLVARVAELEARVAEQLARRERATRLGAWVEQQLAKLESAAATKASLKASSAQRRAPTPSTAPAPPA